MLRNYANIADRIRCGDYGGFLLLSNVYAEAIQVQVLGQPMRNKCLCLDSKCQKIYPCKLAKNRSCFLGSSIFFVW